jgi:hypothetical protein
MMVHGLCSELEESIAKFILGIGKLDEGSISATKRPRTHAEKAGPHKPGKRQRVPLLLKHLDHTNQERDNT